MCCSQKSYSGTSEFIAAPLKLAGQNIFGDMNLLVSWLCNGSEIDIRNCTVQLDSSCSSVLQTKDGIWSKLVYSIISVMLFASFQ